MFLAGLNFLLACFFLWDWEKDKELAMSNNTKGFLQNDTLPLFKKCCRHSVRIFCFWLTVNVERLKVKAFSRFCFYEIFFVGIGEKIKNWL